MIWMKVKTVTSKVVQVKNAGFETDDQLLIPKKTFFLEDFKSLKFISKFSTVHRSNFELQSFTGNFYVGYFMLNKWCVKISYSEPPPLTIKIWAGMVIDGIQVNQDYYGPYVPLLNPLNEIILDLEETIMWIKYAEYLGSVTSLSQFS